MRALWTLVAIGITAVTLGARLALTVAASVPQRPAICLDGPMSEYLEDGRPSGPPSCGPTEIDIPSGQEIDLTPADLDRTDA